MVETLSKSGNLSLMAVLLAHRVSIVAEAFLRMLHYAGMPAMDADYMHGHGSVVNEILIRGKPRSTLFTGSQRVAEKLCADLHGKVMPPDGLDAYP